MGKEPVHCFGLLWKNSFMSARVFSARLVSWFVRIPCVLALHGRISLGKYPTDLPCLVTFLRVLTTEFCQTKKCQRAAKIVDGRRRGLGKTLLYSRAKISGRFRYSFALMHSLMMKPSARLFLDVAIGSNSWIHFGWCNGTIYMQNNTACSSIITLG